MPLQIMVDDRPRAAVIVFRGMLDAKGSDTKGAGRSQNPADRTRLRGWKEIGRFFGVDERTVKRWEGARGLPVHRLPGEARAPVYAFADELNAWVEMNRAAADDPLVERALDQPPPARRRGLWGLMWGMLALAVVAALWFGVRAIEGERLAETRTEELARLAVGQVAALNDSLESPPGTVAVRAGLAADAVEILGRVADVRGADGDLRLAAAEGWRRLAVLQNAIDRPSLRDRAAARQSLEKGLALLSGDPRPEAAIVRARLSIEAARQAAGAGALEEARGFLARAEPVVLEERGELAQDWWLASAEVASWAGDHQAAASAARRARGSVADSPPARLREVRARDLEAEALYYLGDLAGAKAVYTQALEAAAAGADRWPTDSRLRWGLLRQRWNLGSTLVAAGEARAAVPLLRDALAGWEALARADPSDEALAAWVRATRLSMGQALEAAGDRATAIEVLSEVVAERRQWLAGRPEDGDRRRMLVKGLATLGDALAKAGRRAEACLLYDEAEGLIGRMEADGQLTGIDRAETLRLLRAARTSLCVGGP